MGNCFCKRDLIAPHVCFGSASSTRYYFPRLNAWWATRVASSPLVGSTATEILISEVLIISIFIPALARASKKVAATPECDRMPTPTTETLTIFVLLQVCLRFRQQSALSRLSLPGKHLRKER